MFGRFAYSLSALVGLTFFGFDRLRLLEFFDVSSPISDRMYANSRTLDIGKAFRLTQWQRLGLEVVGVRFCVWGCGLLEAGYDEMGY